MRIKLPARGRGLTPALLAVLVLASAALAQPKSEYAEKGATVCLDCHETARVMGIVDTVHADSGKAHTPAAERQCESCHGPSKVHMQFPMQIENVHFGKTSKASPAVQNQRCLECHSDDDDKSEWNASAHGFEHVVCSTCHNLHSEAKIVPTHANVTEGCSTGGCHDELLVKSKDAKASHPIGVELADQKAFACSDCHNPHGPLGSGRCLDCHEQEPAVIAKQSEKAQRFHNVATARGTDCMRCHRDIAHPLPAEVLEAARREQLRHAR